jgi:hypothetical protein
VGTEDFEHLLSAINRSQLIAGRLAGQIYVAEDEDGRVVGAAVWFGPGREMYDRYVLLASYCAMTWLSSQPPPSEDQRLLALAPLMEAMPDDVTKWQESVRVAPILHVRVGY